MTVCNLYIFPINFKERLLHKWPEKIIYEIYSEGSCLTSVENFCLPYNLSLVNRLLNF